MTQHTELYVSLTSTVIITASTTLKELDVRGNCLGDDGISVITVGLKFNKALTKLKVSHCKFSEKGAVVASYVYSIFNVHTYGGLSV